MWGIVALVMLVLLLSYEAVGGLRVVSDNRHSYEDTMITRKLDDTMSIRGPGGHGNRRRLLSNVLIKNQSNPIARDA